MPLSKPSGNAAPERSLYQVRMGCWTASNEPVEESVLETSQKGRSQATAGQKRMGCGFSYREHIYSASRVRQEKGGPNISYFRGL